MRNRIHVGIDGSCDVWDSQQRVDELRVSSSAATDDGNHPASRAGGRVITEPNAIENIGRTRTDATVSRLRLKDGERLYPKNWSGGTPIGGFAREVGAWLGYVDPKHDPGKMIQRITKGTLRATEAWTDGHWAEDDRHVELNCELAVALAYATEGAARATVLRITETEPSHGFVAWKAYVDVVERLGDSALASANGRSRT